MPHLTFGPDDIRTTMTTHFSTVGSQLPDTEVKSLTVPLDVDDPTAVLIEDIHVIVGANQLAASEDGGTVNHTFNARVEEDDSDVVRLGQFKVVAGKLAGDSTTGNRYEKYASTLESAVGRLIVAEEWEFSSTADSSLDSPSNMEALVDYVVVDLDSWRTQHLIRESMERAEAQTELWTGSLEGVDL